MTKDEVIRIARERGIARGRLKKTDLIRLIQKTEGNEPCFATGKASVCGQSDCLWRADCE